MAVDVLFNVGTQLLLTLTVFLSTAKLEQYVFTRKLHVEP